MLPCRRLRHVDLRMRGSRRLAYRFGGFHARPGHTTTAVERRRGSRVAKGLRSIDAARRNRARAVSKAELQQRLWPSTFVEETNLASLVAEIRRALRDAAAGPKFVRTIYGFGYQFVGEVIVSVAATSL